MRPVSRFEHIIDAMHAKLSARSLLPWGKYRPFLHYTLSKTALKPIFAICFLAVLRPRWRKVLVMRSWPLLEKLIFAGGHCLSFLLTPPITSLAWKKLQLHPNTDYSDQQFIVPLIYQWNFPDFAMSLLSQLSPSSIATTLILLVSHHLPLPRSSKPPTHSPYHSYSLILSSKPSLAASSTPSDPFPDRWVTASLNYQQQ